MTAPALQAGAAIIARAHAAGVDLWIDPADGATLRLRAPAQPPAELLSDLRQHKAAVMRALRTSDWFGPTSALEAVPHAAAPQATTPAQDPQGWRDLFEERAGIREHDGCLSRADGEAGALADLVARWRALNPLPPSDGALCVHCGGTEPDTPVLALSGHAWLHRACWAPMNAARQQQALAAVCKLLTATEPG